MLICSLDPSNKILHRPSVLSRSPWSTSFQAFHSVIKTASYIGLVGWSPRSQVKRPPFSRSWIQLRCLKYAFRMARTIFLSSLITLDRGYFRVVGTVSFRRRFGKLIIVSRIGSGVILLPIIPRLSSMFSHLLILSKEQCEDSIPYKHTLCPRNLLDIYISRIFLVQRVVFIEERSSLS